MEERERDQGCGGRINDMKLALTHRQLTRAQRKAASPEKGREQRFFKSEETLCKSSDSLRKSNIIMGLQKEKRRGQRLF